MAPEAPEPTPYPLYSTTFIVHRLSPLYHGDKILDNDTLKQLASQFRDILAGDVLRGVRVGLAAEDDSLARVGALQLVQWRVLVREESWDAEEDEMRVYETADGDNTRAGMIVDITYEKAIYTAILLEVPRGRGTAAEAVSGFSQYPLLLTRMPGSLRETFVKFLASTFDVRAAAISLPSEFMITSLEQYLANVTEPGDELLEPAEANRQLQRIIRDLLVTVSFHVPSASSSLKTMDVTIPRDDIWRMIIRGRKLQQTFNQDTPRQPFFAALSHYIDGHLAITMKHPSVGISKIACGAFVLGADGRIKIFPKSRTDDMDVQGKATAALIASLIDFTKGGILGRSKS